MSCVGEARKEKSQLEVFFLLEEGCDGDGKVRRAEREFSYPSSSRVMEILIPLGVCAV